MSAHGAGRCRCCTIVEDAERRLRIIQQLVLTLLGHSDADERPTSPSSETESTSGKSTDPADSESLSLVLLRAPVAGTIERRNFSPSERVTAGDGLLTIADTATPVVLLMIFLLLYTSFKSTRLALLIYLAVPMAASGGIFALKMRGMPFSISAGVGFIALFGVAVLNGLVWVSAAEHLRKQRMPLPEATRETALSRLRPVLMTAFVARSRLSANGDVNQRLCRNAATPGLCCDRRPHHFDIADFTRSTGDLSLVCQWAIDYRK